MGYGRNDWQGYFGESFVRVLASAAGLIASGQDRDVMGVDFILGYPGSRGTTRFPKIEVQVKSWSRATGSEDAWHFRMRVAHYNNLAGADYSLPRYLFLVVVPADADRYANADVESLRLRHCGYWVSLADRAPVDADPEQKITVPVPKRNLLTVATMRGLLAPAPAQRVATQ